MLCGYGDLSVWCSLTVIVVVVQEGTKEAPGIIPRTIAYILENSSKSAALLDFTLHVI